MYIGNHQFSSKYLYQTNLLQPLRSFLPHMLPSPLSFNRVHSQLFQQEESPLSGETFYSRLVSYIQHVIGFFTFKNLFNLVWESSFIWEFHPFIFIVAPHSIYFTLPSYILLFYAIFYMQFTSSISSPSSSSLSLSFFLSFSFLSSA